MNRQSLVAKMLHLQVVSALVCILLYFELLFAVYKYLYAFVNFHIPKMVIFLKSYTNTVKSGTHIC